MAEDNLVEENNSNNNNNNNNTSSKDNDGNVGGSTLSMEEEILKSAGGSNPDEAPPSAPPPPEQHGDPGVVAAVPAENGALPGSVDPSPIENRRPSTTLEIGPEGVAVMSSPSTAPPPRLPPLPGDQLPKTDHLDITITETEANINELMNTLECPVCLDTADQPPIYQCPSGHLLCESCNQRLVDCPQCGHALMNSRNRTAEDLAMKLQILRGTSEGRHVQKISIAVSEPHKTKGGLFGTLAYTIVTRYGNRGGGGGGGGGGSQTPNSHVTGTGSNAGGSSHFSVTRTYSDIQHLYQSLVLAYKKAGVIVPPPPPKDSLKTIATVASIKGDDLAASAASRSIDRKCVALDRYFKRLVRHPVVRKDAVFRTFLQEKEIPKTLKPVVSMKSRMAGIKESMSIFRSKVAVTERDPWFQTRQSQLKALSKQMQEMHKTLKGMAKLKKQLHLSSNEFRRDLVNLLVGRSTVRENDFSHVIDRVVDAQRAMSTIYDEQSHADDYIVQLSADYVALISSAQDVLARRRKVQMDLERETKKAAKAQVKKSSKRNSTANGETASTAPVIEITDNVTDKNDLQELELKFETISQTARRELEHFDYIMRDEFEKAFSSYNASYWSSLNKTKTFDMSTRPTTTDGGAGVDPLGLQYEDVAAVSYHM